MRNESSRLTVNIGMLLAEILTPLDQGKMLEKTISSWPGVRVKPFSDRFAGKVRYRFEIIPDGGSHFVSISFDFDEDGELTDRSHIYIGAKTSGRLNKLGSMEHSEALEMAKKWCSLQNSGAQDTAPEIPS